MRLSSILLLSTAAIGIAAPATAQTGQEQTAQAATPPEATGGDDIIVTATKRASRIQDVPFSINAQTEEDIQRANATTIEDVSRNVAGLAIQNVGPGQSSVAIRGVSAGQIARDQAGVKEQVGVYLDESVISLSLFTPDIDLYDLNRVETLRGPQGTLFGSGSVGGTLRYITNQPKIGRTEGSVEANINTVDEGDIGGHLKGAINVPLGPTAAVRMVGYYTKYAGFIDAIGPAGGKNVNDGSRVGGRIAVLWEPTEQLKITPRFLYQEIEAGGFNREEVFNIFANPLTTTRPAVTFDEREQYLLLREKFKDNTLIADLTASYDFGGAELTSISTYINRDILVSRDASALTGSISDDVGFADAVILLPSNLLDTTKLKTWTQELRLSSTGSGPLQWVVGGFYAKVDRRYLQVLPTPGYGAAIDALIGPGTAASLLNGFPSVDSPYNSQVPYDMRQTALFGEATYDLGQVKLTGGGRYYEFKETRGFRSGGIFGNQDNIAGDKTKSNGFSPRVIVSWEPNRDLRVNAQVAKGFRLGGINDPLNLPLCDSGVPNGPNALLYGPFAGPYDDETSWNYEAGLKYQKGGISFSGAAFYTAIRDLQINVVAGDCSSRVSINADKAHTMGLEAELSARPAPGLQFSLASSLLNAEFDESEVETLAAATGIREGNRLPGVPKFQLAATATYGQRFSSNADWSVTASYQHVGNRYTRAADQENNPRTFRYGNNFGGIPALAGTTVDLKLPAYDLVNLSAGLDFDSGLSLTLYANNLFDESPKLSFDEERTGRARIGFHVGQPRTIGLTVRQKFGQ